ncbi:MAG: efflux RND transporter periplasmic adaptor subunit [Vicinamibacteria bacterium]|nr:efflux RND transporter periplasmic adaptor subunit [Vicinamibacteria bacterium]
MKALRRQLLAAGIGLLVGLTTTACSSDTEPQPGDAGAPVSVKTAQVTMSDLGVTFEAGGVVQARTTAVMTARIVAPVQEVRVAPGDRVRAGQVLVVLDGRDLGAQARSARAGAQAAVQGATASAADQRAAQAALVLARATHNRIATLHAKRSATPQELDEATGALSAAEERAAGATARAQQAASGVERAQADSEAAGATESYTRVTAPFDGVVTEKLVEPGNMAAPGMPLVRVEDTRGFRLDVHVDESRIGQIAPGASVPVLLDSGTGAATTVAGTVSEVARAVDADARAFLVKIALPDTADLRSGMFGRARFTGASRRALAVPAGAIVRRGQVTSVFVVDKGVARLRLVNVTDTEVLAGLSEGETVVVDPAAGVVDGRRVSGGGR